MTAGDLSAIERYLHEHIPLTTHMEVGVDRIDDTGVRLTAPLAPNINHRQTAFGGSVAAADDGCDGGGGGGGGGDRGFVRRWGRRQGVRTMRKLLLRQGGLVAVALVSVVAGRQRTLDVISLYDGAR